MRSNNLREIASLFLKLGIIGFGGPAAHIALMRKEVVQKRGWLDEVRFLDLLGATNLIPGPNSTEMAIHIGQDRGGWKGLIVAGVCFILPAVLITGSLAFAYAEYGQLPEVAAFVYGTKPAIIVVILSAIYPLARRSAHSIFLLLIGITVLVLSLLGLPEVFLMLGAGFLAMAVRFVQNQRATPSLGLAGLSAVLYVRDETSAAINVKLFIAFLKIGAILYGSGYVLFAFLDSELVASGYLSRQQLMDAITVGQFTPGPVFSAVTFVGYLINGAGGALIATLAIFLPSFIFVALLNPVVKRLRSSALFSSFLDAVNISSVAVIAAVCYEMGKETVSDWRTVAILVASLVAAFTFPKINSALLIVGGAVIGYFLTFVNL